MPIFKNINRLLILFIFAFNIPAYASGVYVEITNIQGIAGPCGLKMGDVYHFSSKTSVNKSMCVDKLLVNNGTQRWTNKGIRFCNPSGSTSFCGWTDQGSYPFSAVLGYFTLRSSCPQGTELNTETTKCEEPEPEPPQCTENEIYNPETELCEPRWCNSDEALAVYTDMLNQCEAQNGLFTEFSCYDLTKEITSTCDLTHKDKCVVGLPAWPACLGDIYNPTDPTKPIDPPTDFNPETSNPNPEPPPPSDTQSMHHDMNKNFNDINNKLSSINDTNTEIGKKIVEQMQQDAAIYENNKALTQQVGTDTINAINSQTKSLLDGNQSIEGAINSQTNSLLQSNQSTVNAIDQLGSSIDNLSESLKQCDPNEDPNQCQGWHGLTEGFINTGMSKMSDSLNQQDTSHTNVFLERVQTAADSPINPETSGFITRMTSDIVNALPSSSECTNTQMETPFGSFSLGCEFSTRIKEILAYVIYIYTLFTLSEILFSTVTPVPGTVPYSSRR